MIEHCNRSHGPSMIEPIYTFVRGKGWIVQPDGHRCQDRDGNYWFVYARPPEEGEIWDASSQNETPETFGDNYVRVGNPTSWYRRGTSPVEHDPAYPYLFTLVPCE